MSPKSEIYLMFIYKCQAYNNKMSQSQSKKLSQINIFHGQTWLYYQSKCWERGSLDLQDPADWSPVVYRQFIIYYHYVEFKFLLVSKEFYRHSTRSDNIGNQMPAAAFTEIRNKIAVKIIFHTLKIYKSLWLCSFCTRCLGQEIFPEVKLYFSHWTCV